MSEPQRSPKDVESSRRQSCVLLLLASERSGTTFVQETLSKFYPVCEGNESQWVVTAWRKYSRRRISTIAEQERFIKWVFSDWYFANKANYHEIYFDYRQFVQGAPFDYPAFVEQVFRHIANVEQSKWVLNKTCKFCECMDIVDQVFDLPRVVHLVRDGRDVALSLIEAKGWGPIGVYGAARWWSSRVDKLQEYANVNMNGRYLELKYEELTQEPIQSFERIARFYGIYEEHRHARLAECVRIKKRNTEKWRTRLSLSDLQLFEQVAGDTLRTNGYELTDMEVEPLPAWRGTVYMLHDAVFSRIGFYALWFRGLRVASRLIGLSPVLQRRFYRSSIFARRFNWNRQIGIEKEREEK